MKTYTHCSKCNQPLTLAGYFGLVAVARCRCDYTEPGAEGSDFWRGAHVMHGGWTPVEDEAESSEDEPHEYVSA